MRDTGLGLRSLGRKDAVGASDNVEAGSAVVSVIIFGTLVSRLNRDGPYGLGCFPSGGTVCLVDGAMVSL